MSVVIGTAIAISDFILNLVSWVISFVLKAYLLWLTMNLAII